MTATGRCAIFTPPNKPSADVCSDFNPNFDLGRFVEACTPEAN